MRSYLIKKSLYCFVICFVTLILFYTIMSVSAYQIASAEENTVLYETESNNTYATANVLPLNIGIRGNLSSQSDEDWYKFTTVTAGVFNVSFEHTLFQSGSNFWRIYLYDSSGSKTIDDTGGYFTSYGSANAISSNYGISAGTYYVRITKVSATFYRNSDYTVTINFTPRDNYETENNNAKERADSVIIGKEYTGALTTNGDEDWFQYIPPTDGTSYISLLHERANGGSNFWRIYIYDSEGSSVGGSSSGIGVSGTSPCTTNKFNVNNEIYYIKITRNSNVFYSQVDYYLTVYFACAQHDYGNEIITENPTCVNPGSQSKKCNVCGYVQQLDSIPALGHNGEWSTISQPTCTNNGKEIRTCNVCGEVYDTKSIPALGHNGEWTITVEPTCSNVGNEICTCEVCDAVFDTRAIAALDHSGSWVKVSDSTCIVAGKEDLICSICNEVYDSRSLPLTDHIYNAEQTRKPSIVSIGEKKYTCTICGDTYIESDKSLLWVLPTVAGVAIVVTIGLINYIRVVKKHKR